MDEQNPTPQETSQGSKAFNKSIQDNAGKNIDAKTQEMLNTPFSDGSTSMSSEDKAFVEDIISKVDAGDMNLHAPSSIMNQDIYEKLSGEDQAKSDLFVNSTLFVLRQIYDFYKSELDNNSDMMINMVQELRHKKETLENEIGDVLKI